MVLFSLLKLYRSLVNTFCWLSLWNYWFLRCPCMSKPVSSCILCSNMIGLQVIQILKPKSTLWHDSFVLTIALFAFVRWKLWIWTTPAAACVINCPSYDAWISCTTYSAGTWSNNCGNTFLFLFLSIFSVIWSCSLSVLWLFTGSCTIFIHWSLYWNDGCLRTSSSGV